MRMRAVLLAGFVLLAAVVGQARAAGFANYFAVVTAAGAVSMSSGVISAAKTGPGVYDVTFKRLVTDCGFTASVTGPTPGFASANRKTGRIVTVSTFSKTGAAANLPSTVILICGP
jgi:hypothetical protein